MLPAHAIAAIMHQPSSSRPCIPRVHPVRRAARTTAVAVQKAEKRLVATANGTRRAQTFSRKTYSGVPGGCGIPSECAAAMNSPASQKVTSGARVAPYTTTRRAPPIHAAARPVTRVGAVRLGDAISHAHFDAL